MSQWGLKCLSHKLCMGGNKRILVTYVFYPFQMLIWFCRGVKYIGWEEGSYTLFAPEEPSEHTSEWRQSTITHAHVLRTTPEEHTLYSSNLCLKVLSPKPSELWRSTRLHCFWGCHHPVFFSTAKNRPQSPLRFSMDQTKWRVGETWGNRNKSWSNNLTDRLQSLSGNQGVPTSVCLSAQWASDCSGILKT